MRTITVSSDDPHFSAVCEVAAGRSIAVDPASLVSLVSVRFEIAMFSVPIVSDIALSRPYMLHRISCLRTSDLALYIAK
jgi:hypothetical protein